jgi:hypothetical protein
MSATPLFVYKLVPPRPSFAMDMTDAERAVMGEHAAYWHGLLDRRTAVVFGPVLDPAGKDARVKSVPHAQDAMSFAGA